VQDLVERYLRMCDRRLCVLSFHSYYMSEWDSNVVGGSLTCSSLSESFLPNVTVASFSLNGQPNNFYGVDM
jgi:hypothetical protein